MREGEEMRNGFIKCWNVNSYTYRCKVGDSFERKPLLQTHSALTEVCVPHPAELLTYTDVEPLMPEPCHGHAHVCTTHSFTARANTLASYPCARTHTYTHIHSQRSAISYSWGSSVQLRLYDNPSLQREAGTDLRAWVWLVKNPVEEPEILSCLPFHFTEHVIESNQHRLTVTLFPSPGNDRIASSTVLHLWLSLNLNKSRISSPESPSTAVAVPHSHTLTR